MAAIWRDVLGVELIAPFPRLRYRDAMDRYGSDKPDLRFEFPICDASDAIRGSGFKVFEETLAAGGTIKLLNCPLGAALSRRDSDELEALVKRYGAKGLARAKVMADGLDGGPAKFLDAERQRRLVDLAGAHEGDLLCLVADRPDTACRALGALRSRLGQDWLKQNPEAARPWRFLWVTEFPLFERDPDSGVIQPAHHMFTMPMEEDLPFLQSEPERVRGRLYDLVLNGFELGSGSVRIHRRDVQQYGAPPHGGIGIGFDRIIMLMAGRSSLRDTVAFPKTTSAASLVDDCPAPVPEEDLKELHLRLDRREG